jgi:hypothetical protein
MSQPGFRFPSAQELDAFAEQRAAHRSWTPPCLQVQVREVPWLDAEEALSRSAFVDPISVMITFMRIED